MNSGWFLFTSLSGLGGVAGFAFHEMGRAPKRPTTTLPPPPPGGSFRPDGLIVEAYRAELKQALMKPPKGGVDPWAMAEAMGVDRESMGRVCQRLYGTFARKVARDGVVTPRERAKLDSLARTLGINPDQARTIEDSVNLSVYREDLEVAREDGVITRDESDHLDKMRVSLGIANDVAKSLATQIEAADAASRPPPRRAQYVFSGLGGGGLLAAVLILLNQPMPLSVMANSKSNSGSIVSIFPAPIIPPSASDIPSIEGQSSTPTPDDPADDPAPGLTVADSDSAESSYANAATLDGGSTTASGYGPRPSSRPTSVRPTHVAQTTPGQPDRMIVDQFNLPNFVPSPAASSSGSGTVHVNGYTRKDGTYVHSYTRSAPRTSSRSSSHSYSSSSSHSSHSYHSSSSGHHGGGHSGGGHR